MVLWFFRFVLCAQFNKSLLLPKSSNNLRRLVIASNRIFLIADILNNSNYSYKTYKDFKQLSFLGPTCPVVLYNRLRIGFVVWRKCLHHPRGHSVMSDMKIFQNVALRITPGNSTYKITCTFLFICLVGQIRVEPTSLAYILKICVLTPIHITYNRYKTTF